MTDKVQKTIVRVITRHQKPSDFNFDLSPLFFYIKLSVVSFLLRSQFMYQLEFILRITKYSSTLVYFDIFVNKRNSVSAKNEFILSLFNDALSTTQGAECMMRWADNYE
jgi:hypothetical protein